MRIIKANAFLIIFCCVVSAVILIGTSSIFQNETVQTDDPILGLQTLPGLQLHMKNSECSSCHTGSAGPASRRAI